ncbi:MAG: hypothetical protein JSU01_23640 [Bacteroidetes bacterium]|nr:hypothetical protein [Bacteroidota bacterium]
MKKILLLICLAGAFAACKKGNNPPSHYDGVITGYDMRECASPICGGLLIMLKNDTAKNPPPYYHIGSTLQQLGIDPNTKFPIYVDLTYKPDTGIYATYHWIVVTHIEVVH